MRGAGVASGTGIGHYPLCGRKVIERERERGEERRGEKKKRVPTTGG